MIEHILGVPTEDVLALPSVRLVGDCRAEIYHYKGLISACPECVAVATRAGDLMIEGKQLEISQIAKEYVTVRGSVCRIYYKEKR